ncbi:uncharacterized protein LOC135394331 isoform X2 [Ornithodoros turicata]|uniref:uncharacterized protein LOC135394331 isoform X2 n=1 Tax=Ornithodoros turicata TaxID=34597 RepID=UPI003138BC6A
MGQTSFAAFSIAIQFGPLVVKRKICSWCPPDFKTSLNAVVLNQNSTEPRGSKNHEERKSTQVHTSCLLCSPQAQGDASHPRSLLVRFREDYAVELPRVKLGSHKSVNYAKLDAGIDDDDDFRPADIASKRQRKVKETARTPASKVAIKIPVTCPLECKAPDASSQSSAQNVQKRPSLDDKLFERDLKVALRLSQQEPCVVPMLGNREEERGPCSSYSILPKADERCRSSEVSSGGVACNNLEKSRQLMEEIIKKKERIKPETELPRPDAKNDKGCHSPPVSCANSATDDSVRCGEPKKKFLKVETVLSLPVKVPCHKPVTPSLKVNHLKTAHSVSKVPGSGRARTIRLGLSRRLSAGKPLHSTVRVESR